MGAGLAGFRLRHQTSARNANIPADALSRFPLPAKISTEPLNTETEEWFPTESVEAGNRIRLEEKAVVNETDISPLLCTSELAHEQIKDPEISAIIHFLQEQTLPTNEAEARWIKEVAQDSEIDQDELYYFK